MREVKPVDKPLFERRDEANLKQTAEYPVHIGEKEEFFQDFIKRLEFREKAGAFFAAEHAAGDRDPEPRWPQQRWIGWNDL